MWGHQGMKTRQIVAPARQGNTVASGALDFHTWGHVLAPLLPSYSSACRLPSSSSQPALCLQD